MVDFRILMQGKFVGSMRRLMTQPLSPHSRMRLITGTEVKSAIIRLTFGTGQCLAQTHTDISPKHRCGDVIPVSKATLTEIKNWFVGYNVVSEYNLANEKFHQALYPVLRRNWAWMVF